MDLATRGVARLWKGTLVTTTPERAGFGGLPGEDTGDFRFFLFVEREASDGNFVLFGKLFLFFACSCPRGEEPAGILGGPVAFESGEVG
jgi:hypothetical protein